LSKVPENVTYLTELEEIDLPDNYLEELLKVLTSGKIS